MQEKALILSQIAKDHGITELEVDMMEYSPLLADLSNYIHNYKGWFQERLDISLQDGGWGPHSQVFNLPVGIVAVFGSRKAEFANLMRPLVGCIATGNYALLIPHLKKDFQKSNTLKMIEYVVEKYLDPRRVYISKASLEVAQLNELFLKNSVNMVFNSKTNEDESRTLAELAVKLDCPYVWNKAGHNIAIVDRCADQAECVKLLTQYKFYKSGQDSHNLDAIYVHRSIYEEFLIKIKQSVFESFGNSNSQELAYGQIYNEQGLESIVSQVNGPHGGLLETELFVDRERLLVNPVIVKDPLNTSDLMSKKILGPILPVCTFENIEEVVPLINSREHVDSLFYFGQAEHIFEELQSCLKFNKIYYNCTNKMVPSALHPNFGKHATPHTATNGQHSYKTFTRQKLFTVGNKPMYSISRSNPPVI